MFDQMQSLIEELVDKVFHNKMRTVREFLTEEVTQLTQRYSHNNALGGTGYAQSIGRAYGKSIRQIFDQTLDDLELKYKEARRSEGTYFWNVVQAKLYRHIDYENTQWNNTVVDLVGRQANGSVSIQSAGLREYQSYGDGLRSFIESKIGELRVKARFISAKSAPDRRANQIPDVAVMMWFPNVQSDGHEALKKSDAKFRALKEIVAEASNGKATVDKIDNPALIHKDRISPSVERWLEKSLLVICDLEGNRPNVYYEFGYARAFGTDVIAICPASFKAEFHLAQWHIDYYDSLAHLKQLLIPKIQSGLITQDLSGSN